MMRIIGLTTSLLAAAAIWGTAQGQACTPGEEACPVVLKMAPGARSMKRRVLYRVNIPIFISSLTPKADRSLSSTPKVED